MFATSAGKLAWVGTNGFIREFDGTSNTANRVYTLPDASGKFGLLESAQTWTGINVFGNVGSNIRVTGDGTTANDGAFLANASGDIFISNWTTTRGFSIANTTGNITQLGSGNIRLGNVGIQTAASATDRLSVNGSSTFTQTINANGTGANIRLRSDGTSANDGGAYVNDSGTITFGNWNQTRGAVVGMTDFSVLQPFKYKSYTTVQRDALTGMSDWFLYNSTTKRLNYYNSTLAAWVEVTSMASGGIGVNQIARGDANGNLVSDANLAYNTNNSAINAISGNEFVFTGTNSATSNYFRVAVGNGSAATVGHISFFRNTAPFLIVNNTGTSILFSNVVSLKGGSGTSSLTLTGGYGAANVGDALILGSGAVDAGVYTATSGTLNIVSIGASNDRISATSGNMTMNMLNLKASINTTGTYSGIVRGVYYNPGLTSTTGVDHRAIETTTGNVLFATTSGRVSIGGNIAPAYPLVIQQNTEVFYAAASVSSSDLAVVNCFRNSLPFFTIFCTSALATFTADLLPESRNFPRLISNALKEVSISAKEVPIASW